MSKFIKLMDNGLRLERKAGGWYVCLEEDQQSVDLRRLIRKIACLPGDYFTVQSIQRIMPGFSPSAIEAGLYQLGHKKNTNGYYQKMGV